MQTGFGNFQSMFIVPGPEPWFPSPNVPKGAVTRHTYRSAVAGDTRDFYVYTPAGYDARRSRAYPILYLLHGLGDDAERWMNGGGAPHIMWPGAGGGGRGAGAPPAATAAGAAPAGGRGGRGGGQSIDPSVFASNFPNVDARINSRINLLWITCGTADSLIGVNRQFKDWLKTKGVKFEELEVADVGHVWPFWRQNLAEFAERIFK